MPNEIEQHDNKVWQKEVMEAIADNEKTLVMLTDKLKRMESLFETWDDMQGTIRTLSKIGKFAAWLSTFLGVAWFISELAKFFMKIKS